MSDQKDWLQYGVKVETPRGTATVQSITEDDGVDTSMGNFCRSELNKVEVPYIPKVGEECEVLNSSFAHPEWEKCTPHYIGEFKSIYTSESCKERVCEVVFLAFRPVKSERERVIEWTEATIRMEFDEYPCTDELFGYLHKIGALKIPD